LIDNKVIVEFKKNGLSPNELEPPQQSKSPLLEILTTKLYLFQLLVLSLQGGVLWAVFYGMATSVQDLGLKNVNENGIFFGIFQCIGYMSVLPFIHKQKRKKWTIVYQIITMTGAIVLGVLSKMDQTHLI
jgi:hypothetical protein